MTAKSARAIRIEVSPEENGRTVQRLLHDHAELSHSRAKGLIASGGVRRNGRPIDRSDTRVRAGDVIEAAFDPERRYREAPPALRGGAGFRIVYQDDDVVVVEKDAGVLTVPTPSREDDALVQRVEGAYKKRGFRSSDLHVVHRIDRFTSGLVVFARHAIARDRLRRAFASRVPERVYLAVVEGRLAEEGGRLQHRLVEDPKSYKVRVALPGETGRHASCRWSVVERFEHATLVEVTLETGRRNQIRAQFAGEGHPLVGDIPFGSRSALISRTALHAHRLGFDSPSKREPLRFESEPPRDFRDLLRALRRGAAPRPGGEPTRPPSRERRCK